jgi:NitT/TauT family transport system ATP-binding protein
LEKVPKEMSGGMRQRVALARAVALSHKVIPMDEPFTSLDFQTRKLMQVYLLDAWQRAGSTVLLVTHDLSEAITLADRLVVFSGAHASTICIRRLRDLAYASKRRRHRFVSFKI